MQFDELQLDALLMESLARMGHTTPTNIQQQVLPVAMDQRDILANAPTGTGKTAAFLLPAIQHLLDYPRKFAGPPRVLILAPTRELAVQVHQYASHLAYGSDLKAGVITGGQDYIKQKEMLSGKLDILVATPGRLQEYIHKDEIALDAIEILVIDEADRMLDMGFRQVVSELAQGCFNRQQSMLFSATLEGAGVNAFARELLTDPVELNAESSRKEKAKIHQWIHIADDFNHKVNLLIHILNQEDVTRAIVFVKTRERVAQLEGLLQSAGIKAAFLRGDMEQKARFQAISRLSKSDVNVLIATDVAARGIDVEAVSHVINFDMPRTADTYVHRIGRTGRAGAKGTAINLLEAHDAAVVGKIERYMKERLARRIIPELRPQFKEARPPAKKKNKVKIKANAKARKKATAKKKKK
ncbi:ATP-dependent RNA helicase SrmB [Paraferrimonas sp. SM1919]|uniref:ATP-dependent RNA helicase SrmB n=1 Tax=Paraferrimonas sp. SM1919 TaxID=2662263 RepID=UPI0013D71D5E|nr:ATP-dependent RNA helicase SrmB [Paraferrimonas sp. SM1919]